MARSSANQDDMLLLLFLAVQPARPQRVSPLLLHHPTTYRHQWPKKKKVLLIAEQPAPNDIYSEVAIRWANLEQPEAVLPLPLLYHGDEPHDEVERKQDPARPQQVYLAFPSQGTDVRFLQYIVVDPSQKPTFSFLFRFPCYSP
jgi:hypothetical protein